VVINLEGFSDNKQRGIHIHTYGDMSKGCDSACDHYNPENKLHGNYLLHGNNRHVGDMINNIKPIDRKVYVEYEDPLIDLYGKHTVIGRMVVVHADSDDCGMYRDVNELSATTGNAGKRIACAVIGLAKPEHF
jgi:Cu-Zn family superoxide dismutase